MLWKMANKIKKEKYNSSKNKVSVALSPRRSIQVIYSTQSVIQWYKTPEAHRLSPLSFTAR